MDLDLDGPLMLVLVAAGIFILALAVWPISAIGLVLSYRLGGRWLAWRRRFIAALSIATLILLVGVANALWSAWTSPGSDEDQAKAAAIAKIRSQFTAPGGVQIVEVWIGQQKRFELSVCGIVDSDELTNASPFIFTRDLSSPPVDWDSPEKSGRVGDALALLLPPSIAGAGRKDPAYWEKIGEESDDFSWRWNELCAKTRPAPEEGEDR